MIGATHAVFIGNSITRHQPAPELGWIGDWGMAASSQAKDYAHLVAAALKLPVTLLGFSELEFDPAAGAARVAEIASQADANALVVVELGDNVSEKSQHEFAVAYEKLLAALPRKRLLCVSTWWGNAAVDTLISQRCASMGGRYVFIGNIYTDPSTFDPTEPQFAVPAVNAHPHDGGMARIAERIVKAATAA